MPDERSPSESSARNISSRRRYERLPLNDCTIQIFRHVFFGIKEKGMPYKAVGMDMSEVGMRITLPEQLSIGEKLRLVAQLGIFKDFIEGECCVVWCAASPRAQGEFIAGVEWTCLAPGHFAKIQQIRRTMRSKEFQQKLQTRNRVKNETRVLRPEDDDQLEYKI
ncbi:MAG: PilZ domain-containing protein [Planctomycetes bacterium]|nr:PilZ domain-containing protein [Planctomycetota bacterium]